MDKSFGSATALLAAIRARRIGCRELLEHYLDRVERFDPGLNAVVVRDFDRARQRADAADAALARGESWGSLHGLPMTVKESFHVTGLPTTRGIPKLAGSLASTNMVAVQRLLEAGAVIFGKTNVPLHLSEWQSFNAIYGTTNNPWDLRRTPGGSSGGAAAAVAAGLTALEVGSDLAGSVRVPAHYCGVFGHRPTWEVCSHRGHELGGNPAPIDLSTLGPLARSADDIRLAFGVLSGPDEIDAAGWTLALPQPGKKKLSDYRVAVMLDDPQAPVDREIKDQVQGVADFVARAGARVRETRPDIDSAEAARTFLKLRRAAATSGMSQEAFDAALEVARTPGAETGPNVAFSRADTMYHRDWHAANESRHRMRMRWAEFFRDWDVLICPPLGMAATRHDHAKRHEQMVEINGERQFCVDQMFWVGYCGVSYLPATIAPAGLSRDGLPIGVQIVGPQYGDYQCMGFAALLEREYRAFVPPPGCASD